MKQSKIDKKDIKSSQEKGTSHCIFSSGSVANVTVVESQNH
jgi:hypothetical protein